MGPFLDFVAPMPLNDLRAAEKQRLAVGGGYKSECRSDRRYCAAGGNRRILFAVPGLAESVVAATASGVYD